MKKQNMTANSFVLGKPGVGKAISMQKYGDVDELLERGEIDKIFKKIIEKNKGE